MTHRLSSIGLALGLAAVLLARPGVAAPQGCTGDCNGDLIVTVDELVRGVNIALGNSEVASCPAFDCNDSGSVTVDCLVRAVNSAVDACPTSGPEIAVSPATGGSGAPFVASTGFDLAEVGYTQAEYFVAGTANAFVNVGELGADGQWTVEPAASAAYKTRIVVYRPIDAANFNGTVIIEWLNVSGGLDAAPDWISAHTELTRAGYAWVGVSAQKVGIDGGPAVVGVISLPLKTVDPARYGSLLHPGDSFSYDMFSQAAQAVLHPTAIKPLGDLSVQRVLGAGESQSAFRFVVYINAIHPRTHLFDGYLVHSRGAIAAPLSEAPQPAITTPGAAPIRADLDVPVMIFETESDVTFLGYSNARQADSERVRVWEVAGTSHADT